MPIEHAEISADCLAKLLHAHEKNWATVALAQAVAALAPTVRDWFMSAVKQRWPAGIIVVEDPDDRARDRDEPPTYTLIQATENGDVYLRRYGCSGAADIDQLRASPPALKFAVIAVVRNYVNELPDDTTHVSVPLLHTEAAAFMITWVLCGYAGAGTTQQTADVE